MKKRVLSVLGTLLVTVILLLGATTAQAASSIGSREVASRAACNHTYGSVTTKPPGCTTSGTYVVKCTKCGAGSPSGGGGTIKPLGHNWNVSAPTCTTAKKCKRCGLVEKAALGHNYVTNTIKYPTCGTGGKYESRCSRCQLSNPSNGGGDIPATGKHTWNQSAPTCTTPKKCTVCGTVSQSALGHNYVTSTIKYPTCGTGGKYENKCSRCGLSNPSNGGGDIPATGKHTWNRDSATCTQDKTCTVCGTVGQKALGHNYTWVTVKNATCTVDGKREYRCSRCSNLSKTQKITAPGHTWNISKATCTQDKKCAVCGTVGEAALGHAYSWVVTKNATCTATGTKAYRCSRCNNVSKTETISKTDHRWDRTEPTCTLAKKCKDCGFVGDKALGHDYQTKTILPETCGTAGKYENKCTRCKLSNPSNGGGDIPPNGRHEWDKPNALCTDTKTCKVCSQKTKGDHTLKTETVKVDSCTTDTVEKCTKCSYSRKKSTAVNHTFNSDDTCTKCYVRRSNLDLFIVSGKNNDDKPLLFKQRKEHIDSLRKNFGFKVKSVHCSDFADKREFYGCLDVASCFHYMGHGDVFASETTLAVGNGISVGSSSLANLDLSNLDVASVVVCNSAGVYKWRQENGTYKQDMYGNYLLDRGDVTEEQSIAYLLCKKGAKISFGCNVEIPTNVAEVWDYAFGEYYQYLQKYAKTIGNADQREEYLYDMTMVLAEAILYSLPDGEINLAAKIKPELVNGPNSFAAFRDTFIVFWRDKNGNVSYRKVCGTEDSYFTMYDVPYLSAYENYSELVGDGTIGIVEYFKDELPYYVD